MVEVFVGDVGGLDGACYSVEGVGGEAEFVGLWVVEGLVVDGVGVGDGVPAAVVLADEVGGGLYVLGGFVVEFLVGELYGLFVLDCCYDFFYVFCAGVVFGVVEVDDVVAVVVVDVEYFGYFVHVFFFESEVAGEGVEGEGGFAYLGGFLGADGLHAAVVGVAVAVGVDCFAFYVVGVGVGYFFDCEACVVACGVVVGVGEFDDFLP